MAEIFTPFLAAFILAYALRPVASRLEGLHAPPAVSATVTIIFGLSLVTGLFLLLVPFGAPLVEFLFPVWVATISLFLLIKNPVGKTSASAETA